MIRINLLTVERERSHRGSAASQLAEKLPIACGMILVVAALFVGWWYWSISRHAEELDTRIAAAQQETARLKIVIQQVQLAEQRRNQLQQRVAIIEQLRRGQSWPVHLLDEIGRAVPENLWLKAMTQKGNELSIEGRCLTLTPLSEFIANLEASAYIGKTIEGVTVDTDKAELTADVLTFVFKAKFNPPGSQPIVMTPEVKSASQATTTAR